MALQRQQAVSLCLTMRVHKTHHVVDFHYHAYGLRSKRNCAGIHKQWLEHFRVKFFHNALINMRLDVMRMVHAKVAER